METTRAKSLLLVLIMFLAVGPPTNAQKPLKVLVLYDMEGVSEATSAEYVRFGTDEYLQARLSLTGDVNAAISGLKAAGVKEIVVVDGHGSGNGNEPDVLEGQLMAPARMIWRDAPFDIYMDSYDRSFDAIVAIGMHAGAGNPAGFMSHTYSGRGLQYRVNDQPFNESMILAMGGARMKIPLVAVSGDDVLEKELNKYCPWIRYAAVKHAVGRSKAEPLPRPEINRRIAAAVREGIEKLLEARLMEFPGPYVFSIAFKDEDTARAAAERAGSEFVREGATVSVRSDDFETGYKKSIKLYGAGLSTAPPPPGRYWGARGGRP